jgi:hypothetical protein
MAIPQKGLGYDLGWSLSELVFKALILNMILGLYVLIGKNDKVDPLSPIESDPLPPGLLAPPYFNQEQQRTFFC